MYAYSFRWTKNEAWTPVAVFRYGNSSHELYDYRSSKKEKKNLIKGYQCAHCSPCFPSIERILFKIKTQAWTKYNKYPYNATEYLAAQIKCGNFMLTETKLDYNEQLPVEFDLTNPKFNYLIQAFPYESDVKNTTIIDLKKFNVFYANCSKNTSLLK